jgi:hypothetical protein
MKITRSYRVKNFFGPVVKEEEHTWSWENSECGTMLGVPEYLDRLALEVQYADLTVVKMPVEEQKRKKK